MTRSHPLNARALDVFAPLILVIVTAFASLRQEDIRFWDESLYLERGFSLGFGAQPSWEWNPLYTDMYWLLGQFFTDPIDLYFAGRATTAVLIVLAVWISLRIFTGPGIAITGALVMAALPITYVWPGVSSPSAGFLLVALAVAWRWRTVWAYVASSSIIWLAAATRPEFVWAALAASIIVAIAVGAVVLRRSIHTGTALLLGLGLIATPMVLLIAYGNPFDLGTRSWEAFTQHYELRFATADDDPWQIDADIVGRDFPGATSVFAAVNANPAAFLMHVGRNMATLPISAGGHFVGFGGTSSTQNVVGIVTAVLWVAAVFIAIFRSPVESRALAAQIWRAINTRRSLGALLLTVTTLGAALISTLVIYPRPHYLVFLVAALVVVSGYVMHGLLSNRIKVWIPITAVAVVSAAVLATNIAATLTGDANSATYAKSLRIMNQSATDWILLTPERPVDIYLSNGQQILYPTNEDSSFAELLEVNQVNAVFDGILFRQAPYAGLEDFDSFIENPESFGFSPVIPGSPFLIRE